MNKAATSLATDRFIEWLDRYLRTADKDAPGYELRNAVRLKLRDLDRYNKELSMGNYAQSDLVHIHEQNESTTLN